MLGLSSCEKEKAGEAGSKIGEALTEFTSGVGEGVDKQMAVKVDLSEALTKRGLTATTAKAAALGDSEKGFTAYLMSEKQYEGKLIAKALNAEGKEIGRSVVEVKFTDDDAQYVKFAFASEMDQQLVDKYTIDQKK